MKADSRCRKEILKRILEIIKLKERIDKLEKEKK